MELSHWKGSEYRTFLLYISIVVVNRFFTEKVVFDHFLHFYCAIVIYSRPDQCEENYSIAKSLLRDFLAGIKTLYGLHLSSSNMHNLAHLVDDVERFGPLSTLDAYPFESRSYHLKCMIRNGNLPLSQVAKRIVEIQRNLSHKVGCSQAKLVK